MEKRKERLAHLVDKYGNKANQHNKRGKEQTILREIIKHKEIYAGQITSFKREQAKVVLSYLRITHEMEKVFRDAICMIPKHQDPTMAKQRMKAAKFSYETFLQRFTISSLEEVKYLSAETQAVTLNEIKKTKSELEATIKRLMKPFDADLSLNNIENVVGVSMGVTGVVLSAVAG